jgi:ketol-acid reductoisomerase
MKIDYDKDADLGVLKGKKIAIIGYGSQGHVQAQNLREDGLDVIVSEIEGTESYRFAVKDGFKRIITEETRREMKRMLEEIQSGSFAKEWISENMVGRPVFTALRRREAEHPIVPIGDKLRSMMSWLEEK